MGSLKSENLIPKIKANKDIAVIILSIAAIIVSIWTCYEQNESNDIAEESNKIAVGANEIAKEANILAKETSESSLKFDIITAERQWGMLKDAYDDIDNEILNWEKSKDLKRDGKSVDSIKELETQLEKLKVPDKIRRLYKIRHEKYEILMNVSEQYKPFKERLAHIDFILPSAPVLPQPTRGVSIN